MSEAVEPALPDEDVLLFRTAKTWKRCKALIVLTTKLIRHRCPATSVPTSPCHAGSGALAELRSEPFLSMSESYIWGGCSDATWSVHLYSLTARISPTIPDIFSQIHVVYSSWIAWVGSFYSIFFWLVFQVSFDCPFIIKNIQIIEGTGEELLLSKVAYAMTLPERIIPVREDKLSILRGK